MPMPTPTASRGSSQGWARPVRAGRSSICSAAPAREFFQRGDRGLGSCPVKGTFRSLNSFNYRVWAGGAIVSNIGTWMQRTAQDWLVLTQLTHHNATAVGVVMALQFGPHLLLLPFTGFAADHLDRRKLLIATQAALGTLALGLGILTVGGWVQLRHVRVRVFARQRQCVRCPRAPDVRRRSGR